VADAPSREQSGSRWTQRGFVLAAALLAVVILAALLIFVTSPGSHDGGSSGAPKENANGAPPAKDPDASVCGLPAGGQQAPAVPPEADWELVGTIAAPTARVTGPGIQQGKRRLCFAHSPTGALFAAVNFVATSAAAKGDPAILRELTAKGAARDESIQADARSPGGYATAGGVQLAGFRIASSSADEATVDLAFALRDKGYARLPLSLRWERGDWKIIVPTAEGPFAGLETLATLSGFVPWSGT
jgi:hypothetical protein